ncbi:histidine phosphatase family protein, partial [Chloroflexota bacterium]
MAEIILVRHGETDWNVAEVFRGRIDVELNETGLKQAELLAGYLASIKIDAVYSSPLKRALRTAEITADRKKLEVKIDSGLVDFDFGSWQGLSHQEVRDKYQALYAEWIDHPERVRMPAGESLGDVRERAMAVVDDVMGQYSGSVVLVSHRVVNKVLICALLGLDDSHFWNIRQDTCGLTSFTHEGGRFILARQNDTSYLESVRQVRLS